MKNVKITVQSFADRHKAKVLEDVIDQIIDNDPTIQAEIELRMKNLILYGTEYPEAVSDQ